MQNSPTAGGNPQPGIAQTPQSPVAQPIQSTPGAMPAAQAMPASFSRVPVPPQSVPRQTLVNAVAAPVQPVASVPAPVAPQQPIVPPTPPVQPPKQPAPTPAPASTPPSKPPIEPKPKARRLFSPRVRLIIGVLLAIVLLGWLVSYLLTGQGDQNSNSLRQGEDVAGRFDMVQLPLSSLASGEITLQGTQSLKINGKLEVGSSLVIAPTAQPTAPTAGQLYYDQASNLLAYYNGTEFIELVASGDVVQNIGGFSGTITVGEGLGATGGQLTNTGVLDVQGTGPLTSSGGQNPAITFANGTASGQFWQWDGDSWELATLPTESVDPDGIVGNEVTEAIVGGGLIIRGSATAVDPLKVGLEACPLNEVLKSNGNGGWACAADAGGTVYGAGDGLQLTGSTFSVNSPTCAGTDKLRWTGSAFQCAADVNTDTTYSAGTGLSLTGTTFNNTGTLSVTGSGPLTSSGGQNPDLTFVNGTANGQFWQWDGDSWELAQLPGAEGDGVIGNEVTNVIASAGLTRAGAGTAVDPYLLGLQSCAAGEILKSMSPGVWGCATDGGDGDTTYTADGQGIVLTGTVFSLQLDSTTLSKSTNGLRLNLGNPNTWSAAQTFGAGLAISGGQSISMNGDVVTDLTGTGITVSGGALQAVLGTSVDLGSEVNGVLPTANGGTGLSSIGSSNQLLGVNGAGTALEYKNISSLLGAGTGIGLSGTSTVTITNNGVLSVGGTGPITSTGGQSPNLTFAVGTNVGQFWQWDGDSWELAMLPAEQDAVIGNEVVGGTGSNSGLVRSGTGTAGNPYTLSVNTGNGLQLATNQVAINSPTCSGTDKLQWTGSAFVCAADTDTTYSAISNGGLRLVGTQFGLAVCPVNQILKATAVSGEYACAADNDTTYNAGTGLSLAGTTFNNTGVLTVAGSGAITSTGGQNPTLAFADGTTAGQYWQWDGDSWELTTNAVDGDTVVGNEITNVVASGGLTRAGAGTVGDPYTVRLQTCSTNQVLKSTGVGTWGCAADNDTTYTADGQGIELTGSQFSLELNGTTLSKSTSGLSLNLGNANTWSAVQTFGAGAAISVGQSLTVNSEAFTDLTGTGLTISGGALQTTLGTSVDLTSEVTGVLPTGNGGTGLSSIGSANQLLGVNAGGTALEYKNIASLLTAGTGISLSGTTNATINNTGVLTVTGSGPITSTGGQNPNITFANGTTNGQFWQWNGSAWVLSNALGAGITCDATGSFACLDGNTKGAPVTLGTNDAQSLVFETNNTAVATINSGGATTFKNATNSTNAFQVQNANGNNILNIDSTTTNLVTNPSFETNTTGWLALTGNTGGDPTLARDTTQAMFGTASLKITTNADANEGARFPITLSASTQYTLTFNARTASGSFSTMSMGRLDNGSTQVDCLTGQTVSAGWNRYTCTFTTGASISGSYIYIKQSDATARNWFIDGVYLETGASATPYREGKLSVNAPVGINMNPDNDDAGLIIRGYGEGGLNDRSIFAIQNAQGVEKVGYNEQFSRMIVKGGSSFWNTAALEAQSDDLTATSLRVRQNSGQTGNSFDVISAAAGNPTRYAIGSGDYNDTSGSKVFNMIAPNFNPTASSTANFTAMAVNPIFNFAGGGAGNTTALLVNPTYTAAPSGANLLMDLQNGGTSVFSVDRTGVTTLKTGTNSLNALRVIASTNNDVLRVDTTNERVAIGVIAGAPSAKLHVATGTTVGTRIFQSGANDILQLANSTGDVFTVGSTGAVLLKNTTNSTGAFRVLNATNGEMLGVDTVNGRITIGSATSGNPAGARLLFGDYGIGIGNLFIGESGNTDTDILEIHGFNGISFTTSDTANTERMFIDLAGVHVYGGGATQSGGRIFFGDADFAWMGERGTTDTDAMQVHGDNGVDFSTGTSETKRLRIDSSGTLIYSNNLDAATKQIRMRTSGNDIDFEVGGDSILFSTYPNADFTGTQHNYIRLPSDGTNMSFLKPAFWYTTPGGNFIQWVNQSTNTIIGAITLNANGQDVIYGQFTGAHAAWTDEPIEPGMIVSMTGDNREFPGGGVEPIYGIKKAATPNDPAVLGTYIGLMDPSKPYSHENYHQVAAVGNGYMWVTDEGGDIAPGDFLISSSTSGHVMKDTEQFSTSYVVARASDKVDWSAETQTINGRKHRKISVLYESFSRLNAQGLREALWNGGIVTNDTTFKALVKFEGEVEFKNNVSFSDNAAGTVTIPAGQRSSKVRFSRPHTGAPVVNATPRDFLNGNLRIVNVTAEEFTLEISQEQAGDTTFNWTATATKD